MGTHIINYFKFRERKLFNVKEHSSAKPKENIIFGSLCSGIEERITPAE